MYRWVSRIYHIPISKTEDIYSIYVRYYVQKKLLVFGLVTAISRNERGGGGGFLRFFKIFIEITGPMIVLSGK